jgi:cobalamin biosynthesis protein CobD/CbiB
MTPKTPAKDSMERRLRIAGIFVLLGVLVELVALRWVHPAAFLVFAFIGIPIASVGIAIYLYSLVSLRRLADTNDSVASNAKTGG